MIEISLNNIQKSFGFKNVLECISFEVKTKDIVALIGENGCGKSTILNIITGIEKEDKGNISIRKESSIGYLPQNPEAIYKGYMVSNILQESFKEIISLEELMKKYEKQMINNPEDMSIINKYLTTQEKYMALGGYEINTKIEKITHGFHIENLLDKNFETLSGGEQRRVILASILIKNPSILVLDEPTNHLDIKTLEWFESYLKNYKGTILVVSHDRYFLDSICNRTILIENGKAIPFNGNYSYYLEENERRVEKEFKEYKDQQKQIEAMKKKIKQLEEFGKLAYPMGESFFRRAENIRKRLERLELVDKPNLKKELPLELTFDNRSSKDTLVIENYNLMIGENLLIKNINFKIKYGEKICLLGDNGCGKTTLIKRIIENTTQNIKLGNNIKIGYIPQIINFEENMTILEYSRKFFIGEDSHLRSALNKFYFHGESVFKRINKLSGGEKVRLKLFELMNNKSNFIILDEPTNHIDIYTKETLENSLKEFKGTVLFISHDRYFMNKLADKILYINSHTITEYIGNYDNLKEKI